MKIVDYFIYLKNFYRLIKNYLGFGEFSQWKNEINKHHIYPYVGIVNYNNKNIYVNINDTRAFFIFKKYQNSKIKFFKGIISDKKFDTFIDMGANYGEFSLEMVDHVKSVISIEPNPIVSSCLKLSSKPYDNISVVEAALSEYADIMVPLFFDPSYSGGASTYSYMNRQDYSSYHLSKVKPDYFAIFVRSINFSNLFEQYHLSKKRIFIKIDIEGGEEMILKQIFNFIKNFDSYIILFEFNKTVSPSLIELISTFTKYTAYKYSWSKTKFINISNINKPQDILRINPEEIVISSVNLDSYCNH